MVGQDSSVSADEKSAVASSSAVGMTIDKVGGLACYMHWISIRDVSMDRLDKIRNRLKKGAETDALWEGWFALRERRNELVDTAVRHGCLLHVGVQKVVDLGRGA